MNKDLLDSRSINVCLSTPEEETEIRKALVKYPYIQVRFQTVCDFSESCSLYIIPSRALSEIPKTDILNCPFPIIAYGPIDQIRAALSFGIRDFVCHPFNGEELIARIYKNSLNSFCFYKDRSFRFSTNHLFYEDRHCSITHTEFLYLAFFIKAEEAVVSREMLSSFLSKKLPEESRSLDMTISKLRKKLKKFLKIDEDLIIAERGIGYRMVKIL